MNHINRRAALFTLSSAAIWPFVPPAKSADFDDPSTPVIEIDDPDGKRASFSRIEFSQLPQTGFRTRSPWMEAPQSLEGVSIEDLVRAFGAGRTYENIEIIALDDYAVTANVPSLIKDGAIVVIKQNGAYLGVSQKGPAFLMFPFDDRPELGDSFRYSLCIWQIAKIRFS